MVSDLIGSLVAVCAFSLVLYAPGFLLCFAADLFGFRSRNFAEKSFFAIACSFCVAPVAAHLVGKYVGLRGVCTLFAISGVCALALLWRSRSCSLWPAHHRRVAALVALGWTVFVLLMMVDLQIGHKLYYSVVMADESYRIAFTDAVMRGGVPPANPLYFAHAPAPMHYYYFWYVLCATVAKLAHVSSRQAFIASCVWAGFGLIAAVQLYASHFFRWSRRTTWTALGLLLVTGADLLPALGNAIIQSSVNGDTEWWSVDPIDAWPDSLLWVPHHVASVLCCLFAFLWLWNAVAELNKRQALAGVLLAAAAISSALGLSVYVAIGFAILLFAWMIRIFTGRLESRGLWARYLTLAACLSIVLSLPFLREVLSATGAVAQASGVPGTKHLLGFSVRPMIDSGLITSLPAFASWNGTHPLLLDQSVRLLLLLPGLALELGAFGAVLTYLLLASRRREPALQDPAQQAALFFCVVGLITTMFVSSAVITNNDFGYRAVMLPQFFLTLLSAEVLSAWWQPSTSFVELTRPRRWITSTLLMIGIVGTMYWAILLRTWLPIQVRHIASGYADSPVDAFQVRTAFEQLHRVAPQDAVVAFRDMDLDADRKDMEVMTPTEYFQRMLVMDAGRQILNAEQKCATHFGGDAGACPAIKQATLQLYSLPAPSGRWAIDYCHHMGVGYLLLSVRDPPWNDAKAWPSTLPVVAEGTRFKIFDCYQAKSQ